MVGARRQSIVLPPPAGTILLYAADGLASQQGHLSPAGKPQMPSRCEWVPMFRELIDSKEGLSKLHDLARAGMVAWNCPPGMIACLDDAFCDITFRALSISALEDFAETARAKVVLSVPTPRSPQPSDHRPRAERPTSALSVPSRPSRPRNHPRPGGKPQGPR